ncbi:hydroxyacid dehydrogenase [Pseudorhodoferax sp. Leaf274]|uniref:hydroxyacid dehydrogenase n=1 Tax=Pseudorhodoferax sp. Leaf274 TaxID=1736318 RepID=UPI0007035907|nr:hydroxyacid dehydrogenase [Pseudorhodoferax sp. Leaf274]KQP40032.1 3-phosphoglycerate dehydrogenase [Pseudorhodoferax sp. Leaf274]
MQGAGSPLRVVRFNYWLDPAFDRIVGEAPGVLLQTCAMEGADDAAWSALAHAQVLQITAAKDELPRRWFVTPELLARCPQLLAVSSSGSGCDTIDISACTRAGVLVMNQAGGNADSVAEMALGLMLAVLRRIPESDQRLRASARGFSREDLMGHELRGRTLGIVGVGEAGRRTAALGRAFGMQVLGVDPALDAGEMAARGAVAVPLDELLRRADIVSLHCPRDAGTLGLMDAAAFAAMRPGSIFVSTARGGIHDEAALHAALASGHLGGAGLDVWEQEPPPADHPLLRLPHVVATFHTAGVTHEARRNNATLAATQIVKLLADGQRPERLVNPEVWPRASARIAAARAP